MKKFNALIVDDDAQVCRALAAVIADEGWGVDAITSVAELDPVLNSKIPDVVFLDLIMPDASGVQVLEIFKKMNSKIPVVIISGQGSVETAFKMVKMGAFDYLEKPLEIEKIVSILERVENFSKEFSSDSSAAVLIGESIATVKLRKFIDSVATKDVWVLLTGENGTGKEVVASQIHNLSSRCKNEMVALNCAAIPEDLIESELFGHMKGAFTGAVHNQKGKFELAHKSTLFLDEIGDMSLRTQAKILRVLQEQSFEALGGGDSKRVDVRVIAATNKDLQKEIENGVFREDLFYRLNVVPIHLSPLRERREDILPLAEHFLRQFAGKFDGAQKVLDDSCRSVFLNYDWPGNVRQLKNLCERICILTDSDTITLRDLPEQMWSDLGSTQVEFEGHNLRIAKLNFERQFIVEKLKLNKGNITKTARMIGVERTHLHKKMKFHGIAKE